MEFRWPADDGPTLNAGLVAVISGDPDQYCKETVLFCDFSGGGGGGQDPLSSPLDHPMINTSFIQIWLSELNSLIFPSNYDHSKTPSMKEISSANLSYTSFMKL